MNREHIVSASLVLSSFVLALGYASIGQSEPPAPSAAGFQAEAPTNPFAASSLARNDRFVMTGEVTERLAAGMYSYVSVRNEDGRQHWIVSLAATSPAHATRVSALIVGQAENFESRLLSRRFDALLFGVVRDAGGAEPPTPPSGERR